MRNFSHVKAHAYLQRHTCVQDPVGFHVDCHFEDGDSDVGDVSGGGFGVGGSLLSPLPHHHTTTPLPHHRPATTPPPYHYQPNSYGVATRIRRCELATKTFTFIYNRTLHCHPFTPPPPPAHLVSTLKLHQVTAYLLIYESTRTKNKVASASETQ